MSDFSETSKEIIEINYFHALNVYEVNYQILSDLSQLYDIKIRPRL